MRVLFAIALAGCWTGPSSDVSHPPTTRASCPGTKGTPDDFTAPVIDGIAAHLEMCGDMTTNEAFIRISRAHGTRTIGEGGCLKFPDPSDSTACPVIHPGLVEWIAREELQAAGIAVNGTGLSMCSTWVRSEYEPSISTDKWTDAAEFVRRIAGLLDRYDIAGSTNVHVRHIPCMVPAALVSVGS